MTRTIDRNSSSSSEDSESIMLVPKRKVSKIIKIGAIICFITIMSVIITAFATGKRVAEIINLDASPAFEIGHISFNEKSKTFLFKDKKVGLMTYLTIKVPHAIESEKNEQRLFPNPACHIDIEESFSYTEEQKLDTDLGDTVTLQNVKSERCMQFKKGISLAVSERSIDDMPCHYLQWTSSEKEDIVNCINMESEHWYGIGSLTQHRWPLNRVNVPMQPFVTRSFVPNNKTIIDDTAQFDSFLEPYLISANGAAITFDNTLPLLLAISSTNKEICFKAKYQKSKIREHPVILKYRVCKRITAKYVHLDMLKSGSVLFSRKAPESDLLQRPLWSTRGRNVKNISLEQVLHFVRNIKYNKLLYSQLQIDGLYSRAPGNFYFNEKTFSRSHQFIMELDSEGNGEKFKVATEVFPHVPQEMYAQYAVQHNQTNNKILAQKPAVLDVTNKDAIAWYKSQLIDIMSTLSVAGFRFSGGQSSNLCQDLEDESEKIKVPVLSLNQFSTVYANISSAFGSRSLIGSGFRSQQHTFIADIGPMMSSWNHRKGLKSIIPTTVTLGLMGYPFVLAGPIGGVSMKNVNMTSGQFPPPVKELFIRWLQLTSFLPVMEFSTGPWEYDQAVTNYTRKLLEYRKDVLWPKYLSPATEEATKIGTPIIRPLWWIAPSDKVAQFIDCEFILGKNLLVAPVLYENSRSRDIYLPQGSWWQDQLNGKSYKGGQWLGRYKVGLFEIATFKLIPRPK